MDIMRDIFPHENRQAVKQVPRVAVWALSLGVVRSRLDKTEQHDLTPYKEACFEQEVWIRNLTGNSSNLHYPGRNI